MFKNIKKTSTSGSLLSTIYYLWVFHFDFTIKKVYIGGNFFCKFVCEWQLCCVENYWITIICLTLEIVLLSSARFLFLCWWPVSRCLNVCRSFLFFLIIFSIHGSSLPNFNMQWISLTKYLLLVEFYVFSYFIEHYFIYLVISKYVLQASLRVGHSCFH